MPINRPHSPVNTTQRDGFGQQAIHEGITPYNPNSLGGGCPFPAGAAGYVAVPREVSGARMRVRAQSFSDHFSQATLFWESMTAPEREHIVAAFSFELGKCLSTEIQDRMLANLANVDTQLVAGVAASLGSQAPKGKPAKNVTPSPALSLLPDAPATIEGRAVGIFVGDGVDGAGVAAVSKALERAGAQVVVIASHGGTVSGDTGPVAVTKTMLTTQSVEYDALVVAGGASAEVLARDPYVTVNLGEAYRHYKTIAAWGEGTEILEGVGLPAGAPGVVSSTKPSRSFVQNLIEAIGWHRHWERTADNAV